MNKTGTGNSDAGFCISKQQINNPSGHLQSGGVIDSRSEFPLMVNLVFLRIRPSQYLSESDFANFLSSILTALQLHSPAILHTLSTLTLIRSRICLICFATHPIFILSPSISIGALLTFSELYGNLHVSKLLLWTCACEQQDLLTWLAS